MEHIGNSIEKTEFDFLKLLPAFVFNSEPSMKFTKPPLSKPSISFLLLTLAVTVLGSVSSANADLSLAGVFGDHMVLQRQKEIKIWGWAETGQNVSVELDGATSTATTDSSGRWEATLPAKEAGGPYEMFVRLNGSTDKATIVIKDILVGEVWLCSGQSNMEWPVARSKDAEEEIAAADFPQIRHFKVKRRPSDVAIENIESDWVACTPETAGTFTAVGYYFGRKLHRELGVPIGLVNSTWGGTRVEPWTPPVGFKTVPALDSLYSELQLRTRGTAENKQRYRKHISEIKTWLKLAENYANAEPADSKTPLVTSPEFPPELVPLSGRQDPSTLYHGMIHGLVGLPMRGAIWYQGESNHKEGMMYFEKKKALIQGWRKIWNQGEFPFYFVQIAPFKYGAENPEILPRLWEAQSKTLELPNTGMVVISDIGNVNDIHPKNKQEVGARLAALAMKKQYGDTERVASGPTFGEMKIEGNKLLVNMKNVGEGLRSRDGKPLDWFEVIGEGTSFETADVEIDGDTLALSSDKVASPTAMRFAWHKLAEPNLVNSAGWPTSPFRAGKVPSLIDSIPGAGSFEVVYDLDLAKLQKEVTYDLDRSQEVKSFSRVAYLLELAKEEQETQWVFVSMDAFTDDINKVGLPTFNSGAVFQQDASTLSVFSNVDGMKTGEQLSGNIEFWPHNYGPINASKIDGASDDKYDFDDTRSATGDYGSMQVHLPGEKQTVFAINHWNQGSSADIGIGNSPGNTLDWTFTGNGEEYVTKRLRVLVLPKQ